MADKTKEELIEEIMLLKKRITELEKLYTETWQKHQNIRRFETVMRDSNDSIIIHDLEGRITAWNRGAEKMYGYSEKEALGMNIERLTPPEKALEHKELTRHLIAGKIVDSLETQRIAKDGSILDVWMTVSKIIEYPEDSIISTDHDLTKPIGIALIERNITERKQTEQVLHQSEEKYRGIVDNIGIGIALISPEMEILSLNNQMKKWNPHVNLKDKHICYRSFNNPPKEEVCSYCPTAKTLKDGLVHEATTETPMNNQVFNYRIISSPIKDLTGKIIAAIEMVEDISERKKKEAELAERLRELEIFYNAAMDREERIVELKKEVEDLKDKPIK